MGHKKKGRNPTALIPYPISPSSTWEANPTNHPYPIPVLFMDSKKMAWKLYTQSCSLKLTPTLTKGVIWTSERTQALSLAPRFTGLQEVAGMLLSFFLYVPPSDKPLRVASSNK